MPNKIITSESLARRKGLLKSGRYFIRTSDNLPMYLPIYYLNRVDLDNLLLYEGEEIKAHPEIPDINELIRNGLVKDATLYREYDIDLAEFNTCRDAEEKGVKLTYDKIQAILKEFQEHGFNVTMKAVMHNYCCWVGDLKSGYRDARNGYHLFTPCGCNRLSFRASSIVRGLDWQKTYFI